MIKDYSSNIYNRQICYESGFRSVLLKVFCFVLRLMAHGIFVSWSTYSGHWEILVICRIASLASNPWCKHTSQKSWKNLLCLLCFPQPQSYRSPHVVDCSSGCHITKCVFGSGSGSFSFPGEQPGRVNNRPSFRCSQHGSDQPACSICCILMQVLLWAEA